MSLNQALISGLLVTLICLTGSIRSQSQLTHQCLDCICQASTRCDLSKKCHNDGSGGYFCGPYQISWSYWSDGGKPGNQGGPHDFENCLNDKSCSEQAVLGYMQKWAKDCNGDGAIDCLDFAAIHKAGPHSCNAQWLLNSEYWRIFQSTSCYSGSGSANVAAFTPPSRIVPFTEEDAVYNNQPNGWTSGNQPRNRTYQPHPTIQPQPTPAYRQPYRVENPPRQPSFRPIVEQPTGPSYSSYGQPSQPSGHEVFGSGVSHHSHGQPIANEPENGGILQPYPAGPAIVNNGQPPRDSPPPRASQPQHPPPSGPSDLPTPTADSGPVDAGCFECLCYASTGCDVNKQCVGNVCGPYLLSWPFWADSGRPGTDYVSCALRKQCSEASIQGYMSRYARDCNGDGVINCDDYIMIHQYGPGCGPGVLGSGKFWEDYKTCQRPPIDARRNRVVESIPTTERFRPIERPGQPANFRRRNEPPTLWNGNARSVNEIPNFRPTEPPSSGPSFSFHDVDRENGFNPFNFAQPFLPHNDSVYFNDHFGHSPALERPVEPPRSNNFQPITPPRVETNQPSYLTPTPNIVRDGNNGYGFGTTPRPDFPIRSEFTPPNAGNRPSNFDFPSRPSFNPVSSDPNYNPYPRNRLTAQPAFNPLPQPTPRAVFPTTTEPPPPVEVSSLIPNEGDRSDALRLAPKKDNTSMSNECLECICEATTKCDSNYPCNTYGGTQQCGPYQISIAYWLQAGKPGYNGGSSDFINCVSNMDCAQETLKGYVKTLGRDCNGDGTIDCVDYALIHRLGPNSCQDQGFLDSPYWNNFQSCYGFER